MAGTVPGGGLKSRANASAAVGALAVTKAQLLGMAKATLETAAFRKAVAVSAACEAYRRAGCDPRELRWSAEAAVASEEALLLSEASATRWIRKHGCVEYL